MGQNIISLPPVIARTFFKSESNCGSKLRLIGGTTCVVLLYFGTGILYRARHIIRSALLKSVVTLVVSMGLNKRG